MSTNPYQAPRTSDALHPSRPSSLLPCIHCEAMCEGPGVTDSWGFREFECHQCKNITVLRLPNSYRIVYWMLLIAWGSAMVHFVLQGLVPVMLVLGPSAFIPGYPLYRDRRVR